MTRSLVVSGIMYVSTIPKLLLLYSAVSTWPPLSSSTSMCSKVNSSLPDLTGSLSLIPCPLPPLCFSWWRVSLASWPHASTSLLLCVCMIWSSAGAVAFAWLTPPPSHPGLSGGSSTSYFPFLGSSHTAPMDDQNPPVVMPSAFSNFISCYPLMLVRPKPKQNQKPHPPTSNVIGSPFLTSSHLLMLVITPWPASSYPRSMEMQTLIWAFMSSV